MLCFRKAQIKPFTPDGQTTIDEIRVAGMHAILANGLLSESFDHAICIPAE